MLSTFVAFIMSTLIEFFLYYAMPVVIKSAGVNADGFAFPLRNAYFISVAYLAGTYSPLPRNAYPFHATLTNKAISISSEPDLINFAINILFLFALTGLVYILISMFMHKLWKSRVHLSIFSAYILTLIAFTADVFTHLEGGPGAYNHRTFCQGTLTFITPLAVLIVTSLLIYIFCVKTIKSGNLKFRPQIAVRRIIVAIVLSMALPFSNLLVHYRFLSEFDRKIFYSGGIGVFGVFIHNGRFIFGYYAADVLMFLSIIVSVMFLLYTAISPQKLAHKQIKEIL
jgi:hypothetical protein